MQRGDSNDRDAPLNQSDQLENKAEDRQGAVGGALAPPLKSQPELELLHETDQVKFHEQVLKFMREHKGEVPEGKPKPGDENGESTGGETSSSSDKGEDDDSVMSLDDKAEIRRQVDAFIDALWKIPPDMPREEQRQCIEELLDNPPPADAYSNQK